MDLLQFAFENFESNPRPLCSSFVLTLSQLLQLLNGLSIANLLENPDGVVLQRLIIRMRPGDGLLKSSHFIPQQPLSFKHQHLEMASQSPFIIIRRLLELIDLGN